MACKCCKETAPYKHYKHTDTSRFQDGVESARAWRSHWNHLPGGPYVCNPPTSPHDRMVHCPDWREYCEATIRHNQVWIDGWHAGMKAHHPAQYKRIIGEAVYAKLAA